MSWATTCEVALADDPAAVYQLRLTTNFSRPSLENIEQPGYTFDLLSPNAFEKEQYRAFDTAQ